jgi:hypothetical protein
MLEIQGRDAPFTLEMTPLTLANVASTIATSPIRKEEVASGIAAALESAPVITALSKAVQEGVVSALKQNRGNGDLNVRV